VAHARRGVQHHLLACRPGGCIAVHRATGTLVGVCSGVWCGTSGAGDGDDERGVRTDHL
jgi:hypothetical protein